MANSTTQNQKDDSSAISSSRDRSRIPTDSAPHALPAAEIESLLRFARENVNQSMMRPQDEELGPGDVQYLQSVSSIDPHSLITSAASSNWPERSRGPDSLLSQTEQQLAEAILDSGHEQQSAEFQAAEFSAVPIRSSNQSASLNGLTLDDLANLDLDISIELGRAEILIEDILKLREGSVVSLDKLAGDPVDILANGRLVARGELLVIDGKFGVRLSEVL